MLFRSLYDSDPQGFEFNQERVVVGRAADADLQIAHAALSRRHLTIERIAALEGPPRFRLIPHATKNPTLVAGQPAVEGALRPGEIVAIGEIRLTIERARPKRRRLTPLRIAIAAVAALMLATLAVAHLLRPPPAPPMELPEKLFVDLPPVSCESFEVCVRRAQLAFEHGRTYAKQGTSVPGSRYRATVELWHARQFQRLAGKPIAGLETLDEELRRAAASAESEYDDLLFALRRDLADHDARSLRATIRRLIAVVPDDDHPLRRKLEKYLEANPLPKEEP